MSLRLEESKRFINCLKYLEKKIGEYDLARRMMVKRMKMEREGADALPGSTNDEPPPPQPQQLEDVSPVESPTSTDVEQNSQQIEIDE